MPASSLSPYIGPILLIAADGSDSVQLVHGGASREYIRGAIAELGAQMAEAPEEDQLHPNVTHEFMDGVYIRRMTILKGTVIVGKVHRKDCLNIVESGDISVLTEFGVRRLGPGFTGVSRAGIQKLGFAHEDTVFTNVFRTDVTDIDKIEDEVACDSHELLQVNLE